MSQKFYIKGLFVIKDQNVISLLCGHNSFEIICQQDKV